METKTLLTELKKELDHLESRLAVDDEAMKAMSELYGLIWIEACYDGMNDGSIEFARKLLPHIRALNDKFHFKR